MKTLNRGIACFLSYLAIGQAAAHDLHHGGNMGFPPSHGTIAREFGDLVPAGMREDDEVEARGVLNRAFRWRQNQRLIACFISGTAKARARVAEIALEWTRLVNLQLDFGSMNDPRICSGTGREDIKIDFMERGQDSGYWSYIGIASRRFPHSMNLQGFGKDQLPARSSGRDLRRYVLHEFGHALGFEHEHQSPAAKCELEFQVGEVRSWARAHGWNEQDIETNLATLQPTRSRIFTRHDRDSIMHYSLPESFFRDGKRNPCWVPERYELSDGDKEFAQQIYPRAIAGLPRTSNGRGEARGHSTAARKEAADLVEEERFRALLVESYEENLRKSRIAVDQIADLAEKFRQKLIQLRGKLP
ncbi:MAG: hypothetical protein KJZ80_05810 [Hyphomicrobiaceae bacterium]|nr:hypothetical protein [Hyphomicrobiaceae bacterium]